MNIGRNTDEFGLVALAKYLRVSIQFIEILYSIQMLGQRGQSNSVDPDQTAPKKQFDQGLHCLPFSLHVAPLKLGGGWVGGGGSYLFLVWILLMSA